MSLEAAMRAALRTARDQFRNYAAHHRAKSPVDDIKAATNDDMAEMCDSVLSVRSPDSMHLEMVMQLQKPGEAILDQMTPLKIMCLHMAGGAASEGGELFDAIKRWALFNKELDRENVVEELGDLEFFMMGLRLNLGITRAETLQHNMEKLGVRYEGYVFSDEATIARRDKNPEVQA